MIRRVLVGLGLAVVGLVALVGFEILMLSRREYLPEDPGYRVDARVDPSSGSPGATPVRLAVLGDSTVVGVGSPTERESLPVLIAQRVADGAGRSVQVVGFGISGTRTGSLPSEQLPVPDGFDVVVLVVGSNNATHATPWLEVRQQTIEMLDRAVESTALVVLAGTPRFSGTEIIPEPLRTLLDRYSRVLRDEQRAAAAGFPGVRFVDLAAEASPRFRRIPAIA